MDGSCFGKQLLYCQRAPSCHAIWKSVRSGRRLRHQPAPTGPYNEKTIRLIAQMHKAISIIQFKLEAETILRRPEFEMEDRLLLERIDFDRKVITLDGQEYALRDGLFPTVDPTDPYKLTEEVTLTCCFMLPCLSMKTVH